MSSMQLGVIGLGTMGGNIARNAAHHGAKVAVFNRTKERTKEFIENHGAEGDFVSCESLDEMVKALASPRAILLMVKAGDAVDAVCDELVPLLKKGDILIDGGNSHFEDTLRREERLKKKGILFLGMGISGGEEGALKGPSLMPGGNREAYDHLAPLLTAIAADDGEGGKCVSYMGPGGAGHFVKMIHNGIEYGLMQLLAETYDVMRNAGLDNDRLASVYKSWNEGVLSSFLLDITAEIFTVKDKESPEYLVDVIKDVAGQKGTGKWTTEVAMNLARAIPTITAAVDARIMSGGPLSRKRRAREWPESLPEPLPEAKPVAESAHNAYLLASTCDYLQGFDLLKAASKDRAWNLDLSEIARIWRGGCIIRSGMLPLFQKYFSEAKEKNLILELFRGEAQVDWRRFVTLSMERGIPVPAMAASLAYYDSLRRAKLPQNLVQAQRDFFGAHTYERIDREGTFHSQWQ